LKQQLQAGKGEASLPAPEANARDNDVARRAASAVAAPAAALAAGAAQGQVSERKITAQDLRRSDQDFRNPIRDNAPLTPEDGPRRAELDRQARELRLQRQRLEQERRNNDRDEEWIALQRRERELAEAERNLNRRERDLDRREARGDDHDDRGSDIAKLLLAGAAGFAVGKLLSGNRQVALNTGDRAVLTLPDGSQQIVRDDNALLYQPGSDVQTETFADGSTRTTVLRADGSRVVTIRDADMNILRRTLIRPDGRETRLIADSQVRPVQVSTLPPPPPVRYADRPWSESDLRNALLSESAADRRFTLTQIRDIPEVRSLVAPVNVPEITFDTGSAALSSTQAEQLATLGKVIRDAVDANPNEMFMIEGYTDAVGSPASNLALSDRRAESVALALTEYFQVPPENMVVQGYGEQFMLVPSSGAERENRRVAVRRITDLLEQNS
jgi:outer membrane protein OmpA-like peptidoglycan-associated protein